MGIARMNDNPRPSRIHQGFFCEVGQSAARPGLAPLWPLLRTGIARMNDNPRPSRIHQGFFCEVGQSAARPAHSKELTVSRHFSFILVSVRILSIPTNKL